MHNAVLRRARTDDRGDIISSWLIKVTLGLAIAGVLLFDVISITSTRLSVHDTARGAAREAADASGKTRDPATAYTAAQTFATELNALNQVDPATFALAEDGSVRLSLERTAPTLVVSSTALASVSAASRTWSAHSREKPSTKRPSATLPGSAPRSARSTACLAFATVASGTRN